MYAIATCITDKNGKQLKQLNIQAMEMV